MMNAFGNRKTRVSVAVAVAASIGLLAGMAFATHYAGHISYTGGAQVKVYVVTDTDGWGSTSAGVWQNVTGARVTLGVPSGTVRLVTARYNAESSCDADSWCSVRIVARKHGNPSVLEFRPRVDTDFAYDAPGGETWEGTSVNRSLRLGAGTWDVWVQAYVVNTGSMYLDDWHFEVSLSTAS
jgi:hypothetical protein